VYDARDVAAADGTLGKSFATVRARYHVTTLKKNAVHHGIHTHFTQIVIFHGAGVTIGCNQNAS